LPDTTLSLPPSLRVCVCVCLSLSLSLLNLSLYVHVWIFCIQLGPWIDENRNILTPEQIEKKEKQLSLYKEILELYDEETDDEEIYEKEARGDRVLQLMQEIEMLGPMPKEVEMAAVSWLMRIEYITRSLVNNT